MQARLHDGVNEEKASVGKPEPGPIALALFRDGIDVEHEVLQCSLRRAG